MVAARALIAAAVAALALACTTTSPPAADAPASVDAGAIDAPVESGVGPRTILPYPAGPYGAEIGDVIGDFHVTGYAFSRTQRDWRQLAFRDITLAEVRSDPKCTCVVVIWSTAGLTCVPSIEGRNTVATMVGDDEGLCALDVVWDTLDSGPGVFAGDSYHPQPATRADLESTCEGIRPPFPAALASDESVGRLGTNPINGMPDFYVIRKEDMRLAAVLQGSSDLPGRIRAACASPRSRVDVLASDVAPTDLVLDATHAIIGDANGRIARVPRGGGAVETVATTPAAPAHLVTDGTNVFWTEPGVLARAPNSGGGRVAVTTFTSAASSIATDGAHVFLTHADGSIGSVDVGGGTESTLFTGEATPASILVDDTQIYWLAKGDGTVFAAPKGGGAKKTLIAADGKSRAQILFAGDAVVAREQDNMKYGVGNGFVTSTKSGDAHGTYDPDYGMHVAASWDAAAGHIDLALRGQDRALGNDAALATLPTTPDANGSRAVEWITLGLHDLVAIASGNDGYVYYATTSGVARIRR